MSRSGYADNCDNNWDLIMYRGAVASATRGARGQKLLRDLRDALDQLTEKKLIRNKLEDGGAVCALGAVGRMRGIDMSYLDPDDPETVANTFNIAPALAREIVFENDEGGWNETPERRFERVRRWVDSQIRETQSA